mmetsp:Transcript_57447/g.145678  ORF Transcript_57447/g.145678 Transcript_57447/m.145678 type:complete len:254 (+) Transcript_57447:129-890(+)
MRLDPRAAGARPGPASGPCRRSVRMPQAGRPRGGGLLQQAVTPGVLQRLIAETGGGGFTRHCERISWKVNKAVFMQFDSVLGRAACMLDVESSPVLEQVEQHTHDLLERWSGVKLASTNMNVMFRSKVLVYPRGAVVHPHLDRPDLHHVSATLVLGAEDLQDGWPLEIALYNRSRNAYSSSVAVYAQPGDLVAYQGARWEHSRPRPLVARSYSVLIMHFKVVGWDIPNLAKGSTVYSELDKPWDQLTQVSSHA